MCNLATGIMSHKKLTSLVKKDLLRQGQQTLKHSKHINLLPRKRVPTMFTSAPNCDNQ